MPKPSQTRIKSAADLIGLKKTAFWTRGKKGSSSAPAALNVPAHGCFIFEKRWGHIGENTPITKPKFNLQQLTNWVQRAQQGNYRISLNLEMYEDGSVSPESYELLKELKAVIRGK